jgi:alginate O-acetyltransferase complex protein AlgI
MVLPKERLNKVVFSSSLFLFGFLPLFLFAYLISAKEYRNIVIILGSLFFYAWGAHSFVLIVLLTSLIDYKLGEVISKRGGGGG